ncbi:MAG: DNA polymerase I, partial [Treponema sp.]|nr:DNA polymerase I [Treponema sp.]
MNNFTDDKTVFLLDSYGLIFREYYAFFSHPLTDSKGRNLSAVFGFFRNLSLILKNFKPKYFIAAMDSRTPTFRHEQFKEYKATRAKTPEDLKAQFPIIEELLNILKIPVVRMDGYEADDVIATLARKCDRESRHCLILSADKDLQQLANANIHMLKPDKIKTWAEVDEQGVADEWGVRPGQLLDLLSLTGDSADNVPGVPGVGPKSAVKLISEYGSLENIYASADLIKGALGEKIRTNKDNAFLSKKLITLCENVPLEALNDGFEAYNIEKLDFDAFAKEMITRELPALAKTYSSFSDGGSLPPAPDAASSASPSSGENPATPPEPLTLVPNHGNYRACTDLNELKSFIDAAVKAGTAAFDTETDSLDTFTANLAGFSLAYEKGTAIYVPLMTNEDPLFAPPLIPKKQALEELKRLFSSKTRIIMHNAKFDIKVLHTNGLEVHIE